MLFRSACATPISATPAGGNVEVRVNGITYQPGDGTRTGVACYFSSDGGATARAITAIVSGDLLYWNGGSTNAGFNLTTSDRIDFVYEV